MSSISITSAATSMDNNHQVQQLDRANHLNTTNRLSFVPSVLSSSSNSRSSKMTSSTFQPQLPKMQYAQADSGSRVQRQQVNQPNANTSGLPTPNRNRSVSIDTKVNCPANQLQTIQTGNQLTTTTTTIPSTIGSALRRRQTTTSPQIVSSSPSIARPGSRLPSPSISSQGYSSNYERRSQSQRPPDTKSSHYNVGRPPLLSYRQGSSFTVHLEQTQAPTGASVLTKSKHMHGTDSSSIDVDDEDTKESVEALPPLKSTTYINKLMISSRKPADQASDSQSEPLGSSVKVGPKASGIKYNSVAEKPSQLVKPLVTKNGMSSNRKGSLGSKQSSNISNLNSAIPKSLTKSKTVAIGMRQSQLPTSNNMIESISRRLSLQNNSYGSIEATTLAETKDGHGDLVDDNGGDINGDDSNIDDEVEEEEDDDYDEGDDEDDDDATTATTLTQTSDSNIMNSSVGQEFNNMIQMLSSNAILNDINQINGPSYNRISTRGDTNKFRRADGKDLAEARLSGIKTGCKVVKSQSLSFSKQPESNTNSNKNNTTSAQVSLRQVSIAVKSSFASSSQDYGNNNDSIGQARPKSRIIFDPTSSQFHVSCLEDSNSNIVKSADNQDDDDYADDGIQSSNEDSSDDHRALIAISGQRYNDNRPAPNNDQDEVSKSLLDTHSKIIALKSLSETNNNKIRSNDLIDIDTNDTNSIRRLKECRGSLESLVRASKLASDANDMRPCDLQSNSIDRKRTKSPVGVTLRSLFGLSNQSTTSVNQKMTPKRSLMEQLDQSSYQNKTATIVRHSSLRSDPRTFRTNQDDTSSRLSEECSSKQTTMDTIHQTNRAHLGSELFHKAGKRLSASSSSLTSKFRFKSNKMETKLIKNKGTSSDTGEDLETNNGSREIRRSLSIASKGNFLHKQFYTDGQAQNTNANLPPRMPTYESTRILNMNGLTDINGKVINTCDQKPPTQDKKLASLSTDSVDYGTANCLDNDGDVTILSDTSTLHGDSSNLIHINKCAELERTVDSLKNKLISKEKELTDLQLKQWSSDYLIDQLKLNISRLEKENAQLKNNVMLNLNRVNL